MKIIETNLEFKSLKNRRSTDLIVLHHAQHGNCSVEGVHSWHKYNNGWSGIGYHFFITKDGLVYRGRPELSIGAHCKGHNYNSIGICVQGDYMSETMPDKQLSSLIDLCRYICDKYKLKKLYLHRDLNKTNCPGVNFPIDIVRNKLCKDILKNIFNKF